MFMRPTTYVLAVASKRLGVPVTFVVFSAHNLVINIYRYESLVFVVMTCVVRCLYKLKSVWMRVCVTETESWSQVI